MAKETIFHEIKLEQCTLSFPKLDNAESFENGKPKFGAVFLIEKDSPDAKKIMKAIKTCMADWHDGAKYATLHKNNRCFGDGDDASYDGYAGRFYLKGKNKKRIPCIDVRTKQLIDTSNEAEADKLYAGCKVIAKISIYGYKNGVACSINSIGKVAEGTRMGGRDIMADYEDDYAKYEDSMAGDMLSDPADAKAPEPEPEDDGLDF